MEHPPAPRFTNGRKHSAGHALHRTAALTGPMHVINSFDLAGTRLEVLESSGLNGNTLMIVLNLSLSLSCTGFLSLCSFSQFLLLPLLRQRGSRNCHFGGQMGGLC